MATLKEIQLELQAELKRIDLILKGMGQPSSCLRAEEEKELDLVTRTKSDSASIKSQGKYLGIDVKYIQSIIDRNTKYKEEERERERQRAIKKLETDIRMEVLFTKIELRNKGFKI